MFHIVANYAANRFIEAQTAYSDVVTADPDHVETWRLMSLLRSGSMTLVTTM